ncbi:hypothetical protein ACJX0J_037244, partial [Zea mays]
MTHILFFQAGYSGKEVESMGYKSNQMNFVYYATILLSCSAEVLDKHLSMVQRDNEQKSQIFYIHLGKGWVRLEEDAYDFEFPIFLKKDKNFSVGYG